MNETLWTYGCSWTNWGELLEKHKDFKFWPDIVANNFNYNLINRGEGGTSINQSFVKLLKDLPLIKKNDIIIFEFTYPNRYHLNYMIENNPLKSWDCNIACDYNKGVVGKFDRHNIDYFKSEKFYSEEKILNYLDFVTDFNDELLLNDFFTTINVFDYIENTIGAKVKYWFLKIFNNETTESKMEKLTYSVWNKDRIISFPNGDKNIDATDFITKMKLRFYEDNDINLKWLDNDYHPNQRGHYTIANNVISSLNNNKKII